MTALELLDKLHKSGTGKTRLDAGRLWLASNEGATGAALAAAMAYLWPEGTMAKAHAFLAAVPTPAHPDMPTPAHPELGGTDHEAITQAEAAAAFGVAPDGTPIDTLAVTEEAPAKRKPGRPRKNATHPLGG